MKVISVSGSLSRYPSRKIIIDASQVVLHFEQVRVARPDAVLAGISPLVKRQVSFFDGWLMVEAHISFSSTLNIYLIFIKS